MLVLPEMVTKVNRPNQMLANRLHTFTPKFTPITLRTQHNILNVNPLQALKEFRFHLTKLYSAPDQAVRTLIVF